MEQPGANLKKIVLLFQFASHIWILLGHRQILGSSSGDKSADHLFSKTKMYLSFTLLLGLHFLFFLKGTFEGTPTWVGLVLHFPELSLLDFLSFPGGAWADLLGLLVFTSGIFLRLWAIRTLGKFFTFEIGIRSEHKVVKNGPYHWLRHPSYTGYLFMVLGIGISLYSGLFLLVTVPMVLTFLLLRIRDEEKMLTGHFGQEFTEYQKHSKKLIPWLY